MVAEGIPYPYQIEPDWTVAHQNTTVGIDCEAKRHAAAQTSAAEKVYSKNRYRQATLRVRGSVGAALPCQAQVHTLLSRQYKAKGPSTRQALKH